MKNLNNLMNSMSVEKQKIAMDNSFPYIYTKADLYLKMGTEVYRKQDFFNQPDLNLTIEELGIIENGCKQILAGKGILKEDPFIGLGIRGFRILFNLFHYNPTGHKAKSLTIDGKKGMLDEMNLEHMMKMEEIKYYNWVGYDEY
jgi:hypothetical protein